MKFLARFARVALFAASLFTAGTAVATAQDVAQFAGQWGCKYSMEPFSGNALDKHYWEFRLALYQNGSYEMQGFYYNPVVGQVPVQGNGQWGPSNEGGFSIHVQGQLLRQGSGWMRFEFFAQPADANNLYLQFRGNTHMTNISCQR